MPRPTSATLPGLWLGLASLTVAAGCDFFRELESEESAGSSDTGGTATDGSTGATETDTDAEPSCSFPEDDRCLDQDRLQTCDPQSELASTWTCAELCGSFVNFTCLGVGNGQHGCWCVQPGAQKVLSCTELESCLRGCEGTMDAVCSDQCFARTTTNTIRTLGALIHCAHEACHDTCTSDQANCAPCIESALTQGAGGCVLERSVCDGDRNDDPEWP